MTAQSEGTPYILHLKDGLEQVGGKDFDELLFREILSVLQKKYQFSPSNERQLEEIRQEAVNAKIALSDTESYTVMILNQERINKVLSKHTGRSVEEIDRQTGYDHYFSPEQAISFGLCDGIKSFDEMLKMEEENL